MPNIVPSEFLQHDLYPIMNANDQSDSNIIIFPGLADNLITIDMDKGLGWWMKFDTSGEDRFDCPESITMIYKLYDQIPDRSNFSLSRDTFLVTQQNFSKIALDQNSFAHDAFKRIANDNNKIYYEYMYFVDFDNSSMAIYYWTTFEDEELGNYLSRGIYNKLLLADK